MKNNNKKEKEVLKMGRYDEDYGSSPNQLSRQRDLVLSINEFCFLQNKTNGSIKSHVGPLTMTISQQEALVVFNPKTKKFEETTDFEKAKQLFTSAPEGWYIILKNPTTDNQYPEVGKANTTPTTVKIGTKVNIPVQLLLLYIRDRWLKQFVVISYVQTSI